MRGRTRHSGWILAAALWACLSCAMFGSRAQAAEPGEVTLTVKQIFTISGASAPPSETCNYILKPRLPGNPLPIGSGAEGYTFAVSGTADCDIGPLTFSHIGVYTYEISHTTSNAYGYTYDREVYALEIYVGYDLDVTVVVYKKNGAKAAEIQFWHSYNNTTNPGGGGGSPKDPPPLPEEPPELPPEELPPEELLPEEPPQEKPPPEGSSPEEILPPSPTKPEHTLQPDGDGNYIEIDDEGEPFGVWRFEDGVWIFTKYPPLENGPTTGDTSKVAFYVALFCLAGILALSSLFCLLTDRRRDPN